MTVSQELRQPKTNWHALIIASFITFLCSIQLSIYMSSVWPYLKQLDPNITLQFFGLVSASSCLALASACFLFGCIVHKLGKSRSVLLLGVLLMIIGNSFVLSAPLFSSASSFILIGQVFVGAGDAVTSVLRNYFVMESTEEDRSRAISLYMVSTVLGNGVGLALPALFSPLQFPGSKIVGEISLNVYTAIPIFSLVINFLVVGLLITVFQETEHESVSHENEDVAKSYFPPSVDKIAICVCLFTQFVQMFMIANIETVFQPFSMAMFNWTNQDSLTNGSILLSSAFVVSLFTMTFYLIFDSKNRFNHRILASIGGSCTLTFYLITFPWWFISGEMTYQEKHLAVNNAQTVFEPVGCNPKFEWCKNVPPVNLWLFAISYVVLCGTGYSFVTISLNTIYSKLIGKHSQGFMMGLLMAVGFVASTIAPLVLTTLFEIYGPRPVWAIQIVFNGFCILISIVFYKRLVPLRTTSD